MANQTKAHIKLDGTNVEFPNKIKLGANPTWGKKLIIGGNANNSTANDASIGVTNGNLHIDAATGYATYLNYYDGTSGVAFGSGAGAVVAWMGPDGDLWKGSSDNNGSKYWHAGNDGAGSGLDADTLDGQHASAFLTSFNITTQTDSKYLRSDTNDSTTGILTFAAGSTGTLASRTGFADFLGYNASYGSYIGGGVSNASSKYLYAGGFINDGTGVKTLWHSGNDGAGSGLDADTVDGIQAASFLRSDANDTASGQYSFTKTNDHAIKVGTIRGTVVGSQSGEYIHMYERVHIGGPSGWGASNAAAPSYGLSTYGGANLATNTGKVGIGTTSPTTPFHVKGAAVDNESLTLLENSLKM